MRDREIEGDREIERDSKKRRRRESESVAQFCHLRKTVKFEKSNNNWNNDSGNNGIRSLI